MNSLLWLLAGVVAYVAWRLVKSKPAVASKHAARPVVPAFVWPALGEYDFEVVGESFHQPALKTLAGQHGKAAANLETVAMVVPDDNNPHDKKAVKVTIDGHQVGNLSRDDARNYRRRLTARKLGMVPAQCGALVMGGFIGRDGKRASYGVRLDLETFE